MTPDARAFARRVEQECRVCIALLETSKADARACGQLEALRHVLTFIRSSNPPPRRPRRKAR
jgi:hypothetical protein